MPRPPDPQRDGMEAVVPLGKPDNKLRDGLPFYFVAADSGSRSFPL
jgi:hypothetical protein